MKKQSGQGSPYKKKPQKNQHNLQQSSFSFNNNDPTTIEKKHLNSNLKQPSDGINPYYNSQFQKLDKLLIQLNIPHYGTPADSLNYPLTEDQFKKHTNDPAYQPEKYPAQKLYDLKYKIGAIQQFPQEARFFQMKAYQWDAIKAGVLYGTWSTSIDQNILLDQAYCESKGKYPIILFFSINQSKSFQGVAVMKSRVNPQWRQDVWDETKKFQGLFFIEWIFVQHILSTEFKGILNSMNYNKPVINQRNGQEINYEAGIQMLNVFINQSNNKKMNSDYIWTNLIKFEETDDNSIQNPKDIEVMQHQQLLMQSANLQDLQPYPQLNILHQLPQFSSTVSNPLQSQFSQNMVHNQQLTQIPQQTNIPQSNLPSLLIQQQPQQLSTSQQIQSHNQNINNMNFVPYQSMPFNQYAYQQPFPLYPYSNNNRYQPQQYFQPINLFNPFPANNLPNQQIPYTQQYSDQVPTQQNQSSQQQQNQHNQRNQNQF